MSRAMATIFSKLRKTCFVAVDVSLEDLPVIDAGLARRSGVGEQKAHLDLFGRDRNGGAMDSVGIEMNGADAAVERGIVVLAAGGHADDLGLDVLGDDAQLFEIEIAAGEPRERGAGRDHERRGAGDARSGGGFGIRFEAQALLGREKANAVSGQRVTRLGRLW